MIIIPAYSKCPKCEVVYNYTDMISEDTSGTEFWSDGFCMAPMRTDIIKFAKCPGCSTLFWLHENSIQKPAGLPEIKNLENSWSLDNISNKEIGLIKEAFRAGLANTSENEITLRLKLWHTINHKIRKYYDQGFFQTIKLKFFDTTGYKESLKQYNANITLKLNNLVRLANLLKLDKIENTNYLLFAEIYRELGDFSKAMIFCYKAETSLVFDPERITLLKQYITNKSKTTYRL